MRRMRGHAEEAVVAGGGAGCVGRTRWPAVIADAAATHGRSGGCRRTRRSSRGPAPLGMDRMSADLAIPRGPRLSVEEKERETRGRKKRQIHVSSLLLTLYTAAAPLILLPLANPNLFLLSVVATSHLLLSESPFDVLL